MRVGGSRSIFPARTAVVVLAGVDPLSLVGSGFRIVENPGKQLIRSLDFRGVDGIESPQETLVQVHNRLADPLV